MHDTCVWLPGAIYDAFMTYLDIFRETSDATCPLLVLDQVLINQNPIQVHVCT